MMYVPIKKYQEYIDYITLRECPFCGKSDKIQLINSDFYNSYSEDKYAKIVCNRCDCSIFSYSFEKDTNIDKVITDVVNKWNSRLSTL